MIAVPLDSDDTLIDVGAESEPPQIEKAYDVRSINRYNVAGYGASTTSKAIKISNATSEPPGRETKTRTDGIGVQRLWVRIEDDVSEDHPGIAEGRVKSS